MASQTASGQQVFETASPQFQRMPRLLALFWLGLVLFAGLTAISTVLLTHQHGHVYPYNDPIFQRVSFQSDFFCFQHRFAQYGNVRFYTAPDPIPFTYPAPMSLVYRLFYGYMPHPHRAFLLACCAAYLIAAALFTRALVRRKLRPSTAVAFAGTVLVLSYPVMLQLFLANMEVAVWILLALGMWAYVAGRDWSAAACFGLAASIKLFPFVYFALLLSRKKYKQIAFGALVFAAATLVSLHLLGPDIRTANREIELGLKYFENEYVFMFHGPESGMDHSLFAIIKVCLSGFGRTDLLRIILRPYLAVAASLGVILYFIRIRYLPLFNQVLALTVVSVLLPPVSHDYTLLHLYTPFVLLTLGMLSSPGNARERTAEAVLLLCFLLLFSSENYLIYDGLRFAGQVKAGLLIVLFVVALRSPLQFPAGGWARPQLPSV